MQIITIDDGEFAELLKALKQSKVVGRYWKDGKAQIVCAANRFMLVSPEDTLAKIAIKPARSIGEAEDLGKRLLLREKERGNQTELMPME